MRLFLYFSSFFFCGIIYSQNLIASKSFPIKNDYSFLDNVLKNKRIVLLGEQSHGDGATFDEKVTMIKYLHEKLGYNTLVFESGLYDHYKASKEYSKNKAEISLFNDAVFGLWSDTKSFQDLLSYVEERAKIHDTIKILGFDCQEGPLFENHYINDLTTLFKNHEITIPETTLNKLDKAFVSRDLNNEAFNKKDSLDLYQHFDLVLNSFQKIEHLNLDDKIIKQVFISKMADVSYDIMQLQKQKIAVQNPRDEQMAKNLIFLSETFPNEKMVFWGASYHFSKNINQIEYNNTTEDYLKQQSAIEKKATGYTDYKPGEGAKLLAGGLPMGGFVKQLFKEQMYSIAFSSFEGDYGLVDTKPFTLLTPPQNSIEQLLVANGNEKIFVEFDKNDTTSYFCSAFGNIPFKAKWNAIFDGLLFIKKSYQPKTRTYSKNITSTNIDEEFVVSGRIYDIKNKKAIPNAEISLLNIKSVIANKEGAFNFSIPKNNFNDKLIIAAMGYISDTISISKLLNSNKKNLNIRLKEHQFNGIILGEVVINSTKKILSAEEIMVKTKANIETNYYQDPYNQQFYYRTQILKKSQITSNIESVIKTFNKNGMKGSNTPDQEMYGEILQMQNHTKNTANNVYGGVGNFAFIFDRDLIMSKSNVLYKTSSYNLKKEGITVYNDRKVYKISFINNSPGTYSTGYGYPAPQRSSGIIFIDTETFAVLKYEHCVVRAPHEIKGQSDKIAQMKHKIIVTYKPFEGKYFINYCNVIDKSIITSTIDHVVLSENYLVNNIMSIDVNTTAVTQINRPLLKLNQNTTIEENQEYWKNANFILQDDKVIFDLCE